MKKLLPLVLVLCLMLCGCTGGTGGNEETTLSESETEVFRNPLNGTPMEEEFDGRVVSVSINNVSPAMPFKGINSADVFFQVIFGPQKSPLYHTYDHTHRRYPSWTTKATAELLVILCFFS
ncbi:MAG: hypothetical protein IJA39_04415, partial [Clostridia bacterium]|nr:hypothetical protein [Clostridia bacterium]